MTEQIHHGLECAHPSRRREARRRQPGETGSCTFALPAYLAFLRQQMSTLPVRPPSQLSRLRDGFTDNLLALPRDCRALWNFCYIPATAFPAPPMGSRRDS